MKKQLKLITLSAVFILGITVSQAQSVLINAKFQQGSDATTYTGAGIVGTTGDQWNTITTGNSSTATVNDAAGNTLSGVSMAWTINPTTATGTQFTQSPYVALMEQYFYTSANSSGSAQTFTYSGLAANSSVNIYVYSQPDEDTRPLYVSADGGPTTTITGNGSLTSFQSGQNWAEIIAQTTAAGDLVVSLWGSGGEGDINAIQIQATLAPVPEPSVMALASLGGIAGFMRLRRKH